MSLQDLLVLVAWIVVFAAGSALYHHRVLVGGYVRAIMSRSAPFPDSAETVVYRPVAPTSMDEHTSDDEAAGMEPPADSDSPDIDAENGGMGWVQPRISRYLTDDEFIIFLATQKRRDGSNRMSANDIVKASKGDRNHVLTLVRQVREGPTGQYPHRTPEQQAKREALGLSK